MHAAGADEAEHHPLRTLRYAFSSRFMRFMSATLGLANLAEFGILSTIFLYLKLELNFEKKDLGLLMVTIGLSAMISMAAVFTLLMKRLGEQRVIVFSLCMNGLRIGLYMAMKQKWEVYVLECFAGFGLMSEAGESVMLLYRISHSLTLPDTVPWLRSRFQSHIQAYQRGSSRTGARSSQRSQTVDQVGRVRSRHSQRWVLLNNWFALCLQGHRSRALRGRLLVLRIRQRVGLLSSNPFRARDMLRGASDRLRAVHPPCRTGGAAGRYRLVRDTEQTQRRGWYG